MEIFKSLDHRKILRDLIQLRKKDGMSFAQLAQKIGVQKTYVSKVMAEEACWSSDQAYAIGEIFELSGDPAEYFGLLVELERCGLKSRSEKLKRELTVLRRRNLRSAKALQTDLLESRGTIEAEYFGNPYHSIVHVYLMLSKFQKNTRNLAQTLGIHHKQLLTLLQRLHDLKVIKYDAKTDTVQMLKASVHAPSGSPLVDTHQQLFRALAIDRLHRCSADRRNSFNMVFSGDKTLQESIWGEFLGFLERSEKMAKSSPSEDVFYMQFDLFPWVDPS